MVIPADKSLLTVDEFCSVARFCRNSYYAEVRAGRLTPRQYGRRVFIPREEAERWLREMPVATVAEEAAR